MKPYLIKYPHLHENQAQDLNFIAAVETFTQSFHLMSDFISEVSLHYSTYGLSSGKFYILLLLYSEPDLNSGPSEIAEKINVTRASMTGFIDSLERDQLVVRKNHPEDRRKLILSLTKKGEDLMRQILPDHYNWIRSKMGCLTDEESQTVLNLLKKMRNSFGKQG